MLSGVAASATALGKNSSYRRTSILAALFRLFRNSTNRRPYRLAKWNVIGCARITSQKKRGWRRRSALFVIAEHFPRWHHVVHRTASATHSPSWMGGYKFVPSDNVTYDSSPSFRMNV